MVRISDSSVILDSGRTGGASDRLAVVALRDPRGNLFSPRVKAMVELTRLNIPWDQNI